MKTDLTKKDILLLSNNLKSVILKNNYINVGSFLLKSKQIKVGHLSNFTGKDFFDFKLQFQVYINGQKIMIYIQLYENITSSGYKHYRIASYVETNSVKGMVFTINLSRNRIEKNQLTLISKLIFTQQSKAHKEIAISHRKLKQYLFAEILYKLGYEVTDNNDIIFGIYDLNINEFLNTSFEKFINDFLVVSILKGHFMANKGYEIELLPSFKNTNLEFKSLESNIDSESNLPNIIQKQRVKRSIPLSLRFKVLHRDKSTCSTCGKTPKDGIVLHVDHIIPYSKGGLTVFDNLRTLCNECNIGRSNKYFD